MSFPRRLPVLLLSLSLAGCSGAPAARPSGPPARESARPRRVILISLDAAGTTTLHELYRRGMLAKGGGFERSPRSGRCSSPSSAPTGSRRRRARNGKDW